MRWAGRENGEEEAMNKNAGPTGTKTHCLSWGLGLVAMGKERLGRAVAGMGRWGDGMRGCCMQCSEDGGRATRRAVAVLF